MSEKLTDREAKAKFDPARDNDAVFEAEIKPLLEGLRDACREKGVPFMAFLQLSPTSYYTSSSVFAGASGLFQRLADVSGLESDEDTAASQKASN